MGRPQLIHAEGQRAIYSLLESSELEQDVGVLGNKHASTDAPVLAYFPDD